MFSGQNRLVHDTIDTAHELNRASFVTSQATMFITSLVQTAKQKTAAPVAVFSPLETSILNKLDQISTKNLL